MWLGMNHRFLPFKVCRRCRCWLLWKTGIFAKLSDAAVVEERAVDFLSYDQIKHFKFNASGANSRGRVGTIHLLIQEATLAKFSTWFTVISLASKSLPIISPLGLVKNCFNPYSWSLMQSGMKELVCLLTVICKECALYFEDFSSNTYWLVSQWV